MKIITQHFDFIHIPVCSELVALGIFDRIHTTMFNFYPSCDLHLRKRLRDQSPIALDAWYQLKRIYKYYGLLNRSIYSTILNNPQLCVHSFPDTGMINAVNNLGNTAPP